MSPAHLHGLGDAVAEFPVVLEQRVSPGRPVTARVHRVGHRGHVGAPDRGAARGVRDDETVAEQLGEQLHVRRLAAAAAAAGELQQRFLQLGAGNGIGGHAVVLQRNVGLGEGEVFLLGGKLAGQRLHDKGLARGRAVVGAAAAAHAVFRVHLNAEGHAGQLRQPCGLRGEGSRRAGELVGRGHVGADGGVGAYERALVALHAFGGVPGGNLVGHASLLVGSRPGRHDTVGGQGAHGQLVAAQLVQGAEDVLDEGLLPGHRPQAHGRGGPGTGGVVARRGTIVAGVLPAFRVADPHEGIRGLIDGLLVAGHHVGSLRGVHGSHVLLQQLHRLIEVHHAGQAEEHRLHDHVDARPQPLIGGQLGGVDDVEVGVLGGDGAPQLRGERRVQLVHRGPGRVQHEGAPVAQAVEHIVAALHVDVLVAGQVIGARDKPGLVHGRVAEAHVGDGEAARFLRVEPGVLLHELARGIAHDAGRHLVGAHGAVGAEAVEDGLGERLGGRGLPGGHGQRQVGHVVVDAHGEARLRLGCGHGVEDRFGLSRRELLGGESVAAPDDAHVRAHGGHGGLHVQEERLAQAARLLRAVQRAHGARGGRQGR